MGIGSGITLLNIGCRPHYALERGQPVPDKCLRWIKKRERYIARHRQDFRVNGVIAMMKWAGFVDADVDGTTTGDSLRYMLDLIER